MNDWFDQTYTKNLIVEKVSPNNIDEVLGELVGIDRNSSTIDCGYYTDTRTSGNLTVVGDSYQRNQFLRIVIEVPEANHRRELGLYLVSKDPASRPMSEWVYELELQSMLYAMSTNISGRPWAVATNAKAIKAMQQMLTSCNRPYVNNGATDYVFKSPKAFEAGGSYLSRLYALSEQAKDRIDVDGHGRVTISPYVNPSSKAPVMTLDVSDPMGIIQSIGMSSDYLSVPSRVVVYCKYSEGSGSKAKETEVIGQADAAGDLSEKVRGYVVTDFRDVPDMSPKTAAQANKLAKEYLDKASTELVEWEIETPYFPVWEGDVVDIIVRDGPSDYVGTRRCLVKNLSFTDLMYFGMKLTLKEVRSGDWERS